MMLFGASHEKKGIRPRVMHTQKDTQIASRMATACCPIFYQEHLTGIHLAYSHVSHVYQDGYDPI